MYFVQVLRASPSSKFQTTKLGVPDEFAPCLLASGKNTGVVVKEQSHLFANKQHA